MRDRRPSRLPVTAAATFAVMALGGAPALAVERNPKAEPVAAVDALAPPEDPGVELPDIDMEMDIEAEPASASNGSPDEPNQIDGSVAIADDDVPPASPGFVPRHVSRAPRAIDEDAADLAIVAEALAAAGGTPDLSPLTIEPVRGSESSGFGWRDDPIRHRPKYHAGTDYRADRGTPVYASADGTVVACSRHGGYGKLVQLSHGHGLVTRYGHLSKIEVRCGETVRADTLIGRVGSTGRATGPHLHFEVRVAGHPVDPNLAAHVGFLQREGDLESAALVSLALAHDVQAEAISAEDPPRSSKRDRDEPKHASKHDKHDSKRSSKHDKKRRRVS